MRLDLFLAAAFAVTKISCASRVRSETLPQSYFNIRVPNILRCEKLCERQCQCASVTFDSKESICYMHLAGVSPVNNGRGKYLHTDSVGKKLDTTKKCDDKQILVPDLQGEGTCHEVPNEVREIYLGCYEDLKSDRDLSVWAKFESTNSKKVCISNCLKGGYKYSGLQYGEECWCGNSYGKHRQLQETDCYMICSGNNDEKCGGANAQNIYTTGL